MFVNQNDLNFDTNCSFFVSWDYLKNKKVTSYHMGLLDGKFYKEDDLKFINTFDFQVKITNKVYTVEMLSIKYDEKIDMLAFFTLTIDYYKPVNNIPYISKIKEISRSYVDRNKHWWTSEKNEEIREYKDIGFINNKNKLPFKDSIPIINDYKDELKKMFGSVISIGNNRFDCLESIQDFVYFIIKKEPVLKNTKNQNKINELVKVNLPVINYNDYASVPYSQIACINRINDNCCVVRTFCKDDEFLQIVESCRVYIEKNKYYICKKKINGDFIYISQDFGCVDWNYLLSDNDLVDLKGTKLEYVNSLISEISINKRVNAIIAFLKWDLFEKFYKADLKNICLNCFELSGGTAYDTLCSLFEKFGMTYKKGMSLTEFSGLNFYQLKVFDHLIFTYRNDYAIYKIVKYLQFWFGLNLSDIDNNTFDLAIKFLLRAIKYDIIDSFYDTIGYIINLKSFKYVCNHIDDFFNLIDYERYDSRIWWRRYRDYIKMISHPKLSIYNYPVILKNKNELQENHDNAAIIYNLVVKNSSEEVFIELGKKWSKYKYENKKFEIVAPRSSNEIILEGISLDHCVKSYIEDIILGKTTILFLRKKENIEAPYFTIEVKKDTIIQIHGKKNCNLPKNSEEVEFIENWAKVKKLKMLDYNLLY